MSEETTEAAATVAAPTKTEAPKTVHAAPTGESTIPSARLNEVIAQRETAREKAAANAVRAAEATQRLAELEARLAAAEQAAAEATRRGERNLVYERMSDRPSLAHPDVRELVEAKFSAYAESTSDAKPFGEWIAEVAPSSPVLSPYLTVPTAAGKPTPPNPNVGAGGPSGTGGGAASSAADIRRKRASGTFSADDKKATKDELRAAGFIK